MECVANLRMKRHAKIGMPKLPLNLASSEKQTRRFISLHQQAIESSWLSKSNAPLARDLVLEALAPLQQDYRIKSEEAIFDMLSWCEQQRNCRGKMDMWFDLMIMPVC